MTLRNTQVLLLFLLLTALTVAVTALWYGYAQGQYFDTEFQNLVFVTIGQYAGPLSIVLAAFFAIERRHLARRMPIHTVTTAIVLTMLWALLSAGRTLAFVGSSDESVETLMNWSAVVSGAGFLVDGALAYFFVSSRKD